MKKIIAILMTLVMLTTFSACTNIPAETDSGASENPDKEGTTVMTYAEYVAAELNTEVVVETYVQAKQGWWEDEGQGKVTLYTQNHDGAFFIYELKCTAEENALLVPGTKMRVKGFKSEWAGEIEITDATYEILSNDTFTATALDVTSMLDSEDLIKHQNELVTFKNMKVEAVNDAGDSFLYNWDGSGSDGNDLYFKVSSGGKTYTFTVESYLCDKNSDVYTAVKGLKVGDTVDMEGFLYWYDGVNPHIISVTVK